MFKWRGRIREKDSGLRTERLGPALFLYFLLVLSPESFSLISKQASAADLIPQEAAETLYKTELGPLYHPADLPRLYAAHQLIEQYFSAATPADRKAALAQLSAAPIDAAVLGRICRIRLSWQNLAPGVYYINEPAGPYDAKYFLGVPPHYRREAAWPLVVKLPSATAFVADPPPLPGEVVQIYINWVKDELAAHPDAIVLIPLLNLGELYGPSYKGMNSVMQPIWNAADKVNIDPARVYLVGHSMGAHAAWNLALHYPTYIAAFNAMAGGAEAGWQRERMMNLRNVYPVVWADQQDQIVPITQSSELVSILRRFKIDVDYQLTANAGHVPPASLVESMYKKMRARARPLYPTRITLQSDRPDTIFNRIDWIQVYQPLDSGPDKIAQLEHGTGTMRFFENPFTLDATLKANHVDMTTANVDSMRLYFNDQMIDFSKPLVVTVNNRDRFRGLLALNIDEMMRDQLFLGRGWRYFTAVLDLELSAPPLPSLAKPAAPGASPAAATPPARPHGKITIYNDDGSIQRVIETP
jgi:hypothetical protein